MHGQSPTESMLFSLVYVVGVCYIIERGGYTHTHMDSWTQNKRYTGRVFRSTPQLCVGVEICTSSSTWRVMSHAWSIPNKVKVILHDLCIAWALSLMLIETETHTINTDRP